MNSKSYSSNSYALNKVPVDKLSNTSNLLVKKTDNENHIEYEQKRSQLIDNLQKNIELKFNSPNYRTENPINYKNQGPNSCIQYKPQTKLTQFSNIDHLAGHVEPDAKRQLKTGTFQHLSMISPEKSWKPSSKRIDFKPALEQPKRQQYLEEKQQLRKSSYHDKYARDPILQGETVKVGDKYTQGIKCVQPSNQQISASIQKQNDQRHGLNGERKKRQYEAPAKTHYNIFSPSKRAVQTQPDYESTNSYAQQYENKKNSNNIVNQKKKVDFQRSEEVNIATKIDREIRDQNLNQKNLNMNLFKSEEVKAGTQHDAALGSANINLPNQRNLNKNVNIYKHQNSLSQNFIEEQWPLRSDMPSKKQTQNGNPTASQNRQKQIDVHSVLKFDYGMPNRECTAKIGYQDPKNFTGSAIFEQANQGDFRRKYHVLAKEEKLATAYSLKNLKIY